MQLRSFFLNSVPLGYDLLDYNSLILEAIINPGQIKLNSLDLNYLNTEFKKLNISFREGPLLRGYTNSEEIIIVYSKNDKIEEVEAMIGHEIIHREQHKKSPYFLEQTISRVNEINELANLFNSTGDMKYMRKREKLYNFFTNETPYELMAYAYQLVKDRKNYKLNSIEHIIEYYEKILGHKSPKKFIQYVRMYWVIKDKI